MTKAFSKITLYYIIKSVYKFILDLDPDLYKQKFLFPNFDISSCGRKFHTSMKSCDHGLYFFSLHQLKGSEHFIRMLWQKKPPANLTVIIAYSCFSLFHKQNILTSASILGSKAKTKERKKKSLVRRRWSFVLQLAWKVKSSWQFEYQLCT